MPTSHIILVYYLHGRAAFLALLFNNHRVHKFLIIQILSFHFGEYRSPTYGNLKGFTISYYSSHPLRSAANWKGGSIAVPESISAAEFSSGYSRHTHGNHSVYHFQSELFAESIQDNLLPYLAEASTSLQWVSLDLCQLCWCNPPHWPLHSTFCLPPHPPLAFLCCLR